MIVRMYEVLRGSERAFRCDPLLLRFMIRRCGQHGISSLSFPFKKEHFGCCPKGRKERTLFVSEMTMDST